VLYDITEKIQCEACLSSRDLHKLIGRRMDSRQGFFPRKKIGMMVSVLRCFQCGLIFSTPQVRPLDIDSHYGNPIEYFSSEELAFELQVDTTYSDSAELRDQWLLEGIDIPIDPFVGMRALDIGVGHGKNYLWLERAGFEVYGIEPSLSFYSRLIDQMRIDASRLKNNPVEEAVFPSDYFNYITFGAVLEHLYSPREALIRVSKWLAPGGVIHCEVPSSNWLGSKIVNAYFTMIGTQFTTHLSPLHPPFHLYEFTASALDYLGKAAGLEILRLRVIPCGSSFLPRQLSSVAHFLMEYTGTGMQIELYYRKPG